MNPLSISQYTVSSAVGTGCAENWQALISGVTGLKPCRFYDIKNLSAFVGEVKILDSVKLDQSLADYDCRNNRLALLGLEQDNFLSATQTAIKKYGASRVGVFIGTSTSGIFQTEQAYIASKDFQELPDWYHYRGSQNIYSVTDFVRHCTGAKGHSNAISTACSSSAKVFASAQRAITNGLCDAAIVGGVDTLCLTTLYGFNSLQLVADEICRPADINRKGISIGEAAGFALLEPSTDLEGPLLVSYGESSDAHHMSSPHPDGNGAYAAMQDALALANIEANNIDYINLHGTATSSNDLAEAKAVERLFGKSVPCSSSKGWTGHTLGAAGIVEAVYSLLCIENDWLPQSLNTETIDPKININIVMEAKKSSVNTVLSNSFGFGGSNCSLIFKGTA